MKAEALVETPVQAVAVEEKTEETISEDTVVERLYKLRPVRRVKVVTSEPQVEDATAALETPEKTEENEVEESGTEESKAESELSLNPNIETVEIAEFDGESNILDVHLHEQQRYDDESALATAEQISHSMFIQIHVRALSGDKALKVLLKYGLRFGRNVMFPSL